MFAVWLVLPDVPVKVTVEVPAGVPGPGITGRGVLLPPPQEATAATIISAPKGRDKAFHKRFLLGIPIAKTNPTNPTPPNTFMARPLVAGSAAVGAVVMMVSVVFPFAVTLVGLKLQLVSDGRPLVQAKLTMPVKPFCGVMVMV